jgi:hypothetical protein
MFWRVFMRISYSCPAHLKFGLTVEEWSKLVTLTGESIDWLDENDCIYDVWLLVAYAATSCALVQVRADLHWGINFNLTLFRSTIHGHGERTRMQQPSCANFEIVLGDGKPHYRLIICQCDGRPVSISYRSRLWTLC